MIGSIIDKYEVLQKIGEGGMATVYRGRHVMLDRDVAIKVLHPHLSSTERNRKRFAREAQAIERLDHSNILKILDYSGVKGEKCYIIMELIEGPTLRELLEERRRLPSEIVAIIGFELASALNYAHDLGLVHRDLKPENVMLCRDGTIKLTDFGIARFIDDAQLTMTGTLVGSPAYMSPEQAMEEDVLPASDFFSLGTLLYHLVCGQLPFSGTNPSIILRNVIENNYTPPNEVRTDISAPLSNLIIELLKSEPKERPIESAQISNRFKAVFDQAKIDTSDEQWKLHIWMSDPDGYESQLNEHLLKVLLDHGRTRIEQQDHLGAQPIFNRLLSIDPENEEAISLIQSIHKIPETPDGRSNPWLWAMPLLVAGGLSYIFWPRTEVPEGNTLSMANTPTPIPTQVSPGNEVSNEELKTTPVEVDTTSVPLPKPKSVPQEAAPLGLHPTVPQRPRPRIRPPKSPEPPPPENGTLTVTVPASWADIYIDDERKGRTGQVDAIQVPPGSHELRLENDFALPYHQNFTVSPGEQKLIEVTALQRKPTTIVIPTTWRGECELSIDAQHIGALSQVGYLISIEDPSSGHNIHMHCPGEEPISIAISAQLPGASIPLPHP